MADYLITGPVTVGTIATSSTVRGNVFFTDASTTPGQIFGTTTAGQLRAQPMARGDIVTRNAAGELIVAGGAKTAGQALQIDSVGDSLWANNPNLYECVVDAAGTGDFTTIGAAITGGCTRIFIKAGSYTEAADVVLPTFGALIGESAGSVVITLTAGARIVADGSGGTTETAGTLSITINTSAVTGAGTAFTNMSGGDFILLGTTFYEIDTIADDTNLTIVETFRGQTLAGADFIGQTMLSGIFITNLIISGSSSTGLFLRALRHSTIANCLVQACTPNILLTACSAMRMIGIVSQSSVGVGVTFADCSSIGICTMNVNNCTTTGVLVQGVSTSIILDSLISTNNGTIGFDINGTSTLVNLTNCISINNGTKGIDIGASADTTVIDGCTVSNNGTNGIDYDGNNSLVTNCLINDNTQNGITAGDRGVIQGNYIDGNGFAGIDMAGDVSCTVTGNIISNNTLDGIVATGTSIGNIISDNRVLDNSSDGIDIGATSGGAVISGNVCTGNGGNGLEISGVGCSVSGNVCEGNGDSGILVEGVDCIVSGNYCNDNTDDGISIISTAARCSVTNNVCTGNTGGAASDGIDLDADDCTLIGNVCSGNTDAGLDVAGADCVITGNRCVGNTDEGLNLRAGGTDAIVTSNNFKGNTGTNLANAAAGTIVANNKV